VELGSLSGDIAPLAILAGIMLKPTGLDRATVRARFNAHPAAQDRADFLYREVERRMLERLDLVKLAPVNQVLDVGCGPGQSLASLAVRYPGASMIGMDFAERSLAVASGAAAPDGSPSAGSAAGLARGARRLFARLGIGGAQPLPATMPLWFAADAHALPLASDSIDMVWSNLAAHWFDDPLAAVAEWHRVIRPGGLLMFSAFGVDTLKELGPAQPDAGWPAFQDMHDWGVALASAGFADPVMDAERLTLTYEDPARLGDDARRLLARDAVPEPESAVAQAARDAGGGLRLSIELIQGHAWCPEVKRRADGLATVRFHPRGSRS
jgi:malonyl-CoA O-methyltransferase